MSDTSDAFHFRLADGDLCIEVAVGRNSITHRLTPAEWAKVEQKARDLLSPKPAPTCAAMEGATGIDCEQPSGHQGDHSGTHEPKAENDSIGYRLFVCWPRNEFDGKRVAPAVKA